MREYTAIHYVRDDHGQLHTPGEVFDAEYGDAAEARLLRLGAVLLNDHESTDSIQEIEEDCSAETDHYDDDPIVIDVMEGITEKPKRSRKK